LIIIFIYFLSIQPLNIVELVVANKAVDELNELVMADKAVDELVELTVVNKAVEAILIEKAIVADKA
jgi:hypothetical protein